MIDDGRTEQTPLEIVVLLMLTEANAIIYLRTVGLLGSRFAYAAVELLAGA